MHNFTTRKYLTYFQHEIYRVKGESEILFWIRFEGILCPGVHGLSLAMALWIFHCSVLFLIDLIASRAVIESTSYYFSPRYIYDKSFVSCSCDRCIGWCVCVWSVYTWLRERVIVIVSPLSRLDFIDLIVTINLLYWQILIYLPTGRI